VLDARKAMGQAQVAFVAFTYPIITMRLTNATFVVKNRGSTRRMVLPRLLGLKFRWWLGI
jgi:hypothetical protein